MKNIETQNTNQFTKDLAHEFGAGIGQEIFIFIGLAIVIFVRDKVKTFFKKQDLHRTYFKLNSLNDQVKICLTEILEISNADRVLLLQLHNGDSYFGKFKQLKVTLTHQYVKNGVTKIDKVVSLPITYLHRELEALKKTGRLQWLHIEKVEVPCKFYLQNLGVEMYVSKMIRNELDMPLGIFGLHYCNKGYVNILNDSEKKRELEEKLNLLSKLIS